VASIRVGVMSAPGIIGLREVPKPQPQPDEVLVRIEACAICTTEQRIFSGVQKWERFPYVGGHEAAGVVEALGTRVDTDLRPGDHVAIFSATCGHCHNCRTGRTNKCLNREGFWEHAGLWGTWGFAEYRAVRPRGLQVVSSDVPFELVALAEPLSCAIHAARRRPPGLGDEVIIIGAGPMGLLNAMVYQAMGCVVTVLDLQPARCERALSVGSHRAMVPDSKTVEAIAELTAGRGPDLVVVASSSAKAYELGQSLLGTFGHLLAFAAVHPPTSARVDFSDLHRNERTLSGAVSSDIEDMLVTGRVISNALIDLNAIVDSILPMARIGEAMQRALAPDSYRVVISMTGS
jgi:threonine dehydrogenase-like Zn-dependent dehydrogenase